jgi:hypothetical protein
MKAKKKYTFRIKLIAWNKEAHSFGYIMKCCYKLQIKKWYGWKTLSIWENLEGAIKEKDFLEKTDGFVI